MPGVSLRSHERAGFSLVELVIVIVIISVIATIAIPRISRGAKGAGEAGLRGDLATLRSAIELYGAEHSGTFPGANTDGIGGAAGSEAALVSQLTKFTDVNGGAANTKDATHIYGPYLRKEIPPLKVGANKGSNTVSMVIVAPVVDILGGFGWIYNYQTGEIIANADDADESGTKTYDQY